MEVTTVSPFLASPTEGDDLCDIDVTDVAVDGVALLVCLCGLAGNGAVLCLLQRNPATCCIVGLAFADFSFLHFAVPSTLLYLLEELSCSAVVPLVFLRALFPLLLFSCNLGLCLLAAVGIERCTSILCPLWCRCRCPRRLSWVVCALLWALSITVVVTMTALCHSGEHERCRVSLVAMCALSLFFFAPALVISGTILFIRVRCVSQQRQPGRLSIVVFLVVLFFLLFALPLGLCNFLQRLGYITVPSQVVFLLTCIHSTINPFVCFLVGRCGRPCSVGSLRLSLRRVFEEPEENTAHSDDPAMDTAFPAC